MVRSWFDLLGSCYKSVFMGLRNIIVCSVSTPEQADDDKESMETQERDLLAKAAAEGWHVIDIIRIPGYSRRFFTLQELVEAASADGEPGPARLQQHLKDGDFDIMSVRSTNRFGREQSINAEVIGKTIRAVGAQIYSQMDGMITKDNFRAMTAITGYRDAGQVDELIKGRAMGIVSNAKRGLPPSAKVPYPYRLMRDPSTGKATHIELRTELLPMWRDLATLILEGVPYNRLETEMLARWGHTRNGRPFGANYLGRLLLNPVFWGNSVIRWRRQIERGSPLGTWGLDAAEPPPDGVQMFYNTHEPVYKGELAEQVKAELRRRHEVYNRFSEKQTKRFAGLVYCEVCHWSMANIADARIPGTYYYLRCAKSRSQNCYGRDCPEYKTVRETDVWKVLNDFLQDCLDSGLVQPPLQHRETAEHDLDELRAAIAKLERRRDTLLDELGDSDEAVRRAIRKRVQATTHEIEQAQAQLTRLEVQAAHDRRQTLDQQAALDHIRAVTLPQFWKSTPLEVNQWLRRLLGTTRLYARGGKVVGFFDLRDIKS